jgi:hypothetical protein
MRAIMKIPLNAAGSFHIGEDHTDGTVTDGSL